MPREEFSYNEHTGKRTTENGYKDATVIVKGEAIQGIGGGVCQVSTILYNSVLYSGLEIVKVKITIFHQAMYKKVETQLLQMLG